MKHITISLLLLIGALTAGCGDTAPKPAATTDAAAPGTTATGAPMTPQRDPKTDPNIPANIRNQMNGRTGQPGR